MLKENWLSVFEPVTQLKGVGAKRAEQLNQLGLNTIYDILTHFPFRYEDMQIRDITTLVDQEKVTLKGVVATEATVSHYGFRKSRLSFRLAVDEHVISVSFFNQPYLKKKIELGAEIMLYGKWDKRRASLLGMKLLGDPILEQEAGNERMESVYRTTKAIRQKTLSQLVQQVVTEYHEVVADPLPESIREQYRFLPHQDAIRYMHFPSETIQADQAREQLIYQELFIYQMALLQLKEQQRSLRQGLVLKYDNARLKQLIQTLPFELTAGQKQVINEICYDLLAPFEMNRLLQGDVGSGKTVVAVIAMVACVLAGAQACLMVPTELLADQHFQSIEKLLVNSSLRVEKLTGSTTAKQRKKLLDDLQAQKIDVLVGTHALFQEEVTFNRLGLIVIDEQHRFGVKQRQKLAQKGTGVNILQMTATPIPRTLAITTFGDMDVSILKELPKGRQPIKTRWVRESELDKVLGYVERQVQKGRQAYIVSPLIEESENLAVQNAEEVYRLISERFGANIRVGLLHGRLKTEEKDNVMEQYQENEIQVLVATSVIEVGVDVPNATMMVILDADRFGLAQLHQLRGRVGRGSHASVCILVASPKTEHGKMRMAIMCESTDGFYLSQKDLELRGSGDVFGVKQSGIPDFSVADIIRDHEIVERARIDAMRYIQTSKNTQRQDDVLQYYINYQTNKRKAVGGIEDENSN